MIITAVVFIVVMAFAGHLYKRKTGRIPEWKYFKPYSISWWSAAFIGIMGILISGEPLHGWADLAETLRNLPGGENPHALIYAGLAGIGYRGSKNRAADT